MSGSPPIAGYRQLAPGDIHLANQNKQIEELILRQIEKVAKTEGVDHRFVAVAKTHIQEGFMSLNRAIFQPGRLLGPIDVEDLCKDIAK